MQLTRLLLISSALLTLIGCAFTPYHAELDAPETGSALLEPARTTPEKLSAEPAPENATSRLRADSSGMSQGSALDEIPLVQVPDDYETPLPIVFPESADPNLKVDGDFYVTVKKTETLESVARTYTGNIENARELARLNNINYPASLKAGQQLRIPNIMKVLDLATVEPTDDSLPLAKTVPLTE